VEPGTRRKEAVMQVYTSYMNLILCALVAFLSKTYSWN